MSKPVLPLDIFGRSSLPGAARQPSLETTVAQLIAAVDELAVDERPAFRKLAAAIRRVLSGECPSIDRALGLVEPRGSRTTAPLVARRLGFVIAHDAAKKVRHPKIRGK